MAKYQRLTPCEREEIYLILASGGSTRKIASQLNRSPSTISREIKRNFYNHTIAYRPIFAQGRYNQLKRKRHTCHKLDHNKPLRKKIFELLRKKWSPEQIAKRLVMMYPNDMNMRVSHETIYSYIYVLPRGTLKKELISYLRRKHKYRRKKKETGYQKPNTNEDFFSIEERPKEVEDRIVPGHWEGDLIIGKRNQSAIGTLVERTTRMTFIVKLPNYDAHMVRKKFAETFNTMPEGLRKTLTYDQGSEMIHQHKLFTEMTNMNVYFAHPRSPWERGSNENTNSLIRQYFPTGTDFNKVKEEELKKVQDELNDRPRKTLGFYTPHEKFAELLH
jgi:transposase, IS30 family